MRLIFFFPSGVTDSTTSILFPQLLQCCPLLFDSARAETSVFDLPFPFSAILLPPFYVLFLLARRTIIPPTVFFWKVNLVQARMIRPKKNHKRYTLMQGKKSCQALLHIQNPLAD